MRIDLDAARAARAEKRAAAGREPNVLTLDGHEYRLPDELPFAFGLALAQGRPQDALRALLDDDAYEEVLTIGLTSEDWGAIVSAIPSAYGFAADDGAEDDGGDGSPE